MGNPSCEIVTLERRNGPQIRGQRLKPLGPGGGGRSHQLHGVIRRLGHAPHGKDRLERFSTLKPPFCWFCPACSEFSCSFLLFCYCREHTTPGKLTAHPPPAHSSSRASAKVRGLIPSHSPRPPLNHHPSTEPEGMSWKRRSHSPHFQLLSAKKSSLVSGNRPLVWVSAI